MAMTLEELYGAARERKLVEIRSYIKDYVLPDIDVAALAEQIMNIAEQTGRIHGDTISGELPSRLTRSRNPHPFTV